MLDIKSFEDINQYHKSSTKRYILIVSITAALLVISFLAVMMVGNFPLSMSEVISILLGHGDSGNDYVFMNVRLPRVLCCAIVGAALSVSGLAMQSLFKNPMASPSVLGISAGASFGASLAISFGIGFAIFGRYNTPAMAFVFCFITMIAVYLIARTKYGVASTTLLLAGVALGAFFNGLVSFLQYIADEDTLAAIVYWTMGSFNKCGWESFYLALIPIVLGLLIIALRSRELNLISAGEEQAANMGVNVKATRLLVITGTSLCVAGSVAISGTIGFVGLIVPHIFRMLVGPNHNILIPLCILGGAIFMMVMDTISKAAFSISMPVGILTALLGAPFFIYVMKTRKKEIWE